MLVSFAGRLWRSRFERHAFFAAATLAAVFLAGYHFGTFDQFAHIPFLRAYADPSLFPRDGFVALRAESYSYFWRLFVPLVQLSPASDLPLQLALFTGHLAVTYATLVLLWRLSAELFDSPLAALLSTLAFIVPHLGLAGFPLFEWSLLNRTFVLPFALWAFLLYLRGRTNWAFLLLGGLFNIHVITVNFVLAMLGWDCLRRWRSGGWQRLAAGLPLFVLGAAPVLIWRLTSPALHAPLNPEWFDAVSRGFLLNLFVLVSPVVYINVATLCGLGTLGLYALARRAAPAVRPDQQRSLDHFIQAVILVLAVQVFSSVIYPIDLLNQLQIVRIGLYALVFGYLSFGNYLAQRWPSGDADNGWLAGAYIASPVPLAPLGVLAVHKLLARRPARDLAAACVPVGMFAVVLGLAVPLGLWSPGIYPFGPQTSWEDLQRCARQNTPAETVFVTPPYKWGLYSSEWRTFSARSTVVSHAELLMVALAPGYYDAWRERFDQLAPGAFARFDGNYFDNAAITRAAYEALQAPALTAVAQRYGAAYIVTERPHTLALPQAGWACSRANPDYAVYVVP